MESADGKMKKTAIVIAPNPHALFPAQFEKYLRRHFPSMSVDRRIYDHPEGGGSGNLVFCQPYLPIPDYETILKVIKAEGNRVFILSDGLGNNRQDVRDLGIDGVIFRLENKRDFEGFVWYGSIKPAATLLRELVL